MAFRTIAVALTANVATYQAAMAAASRSTKEFGQEVAQQGAKARASMAATSASAKSLGAEVVTTATKNRELARTLGTGMVAAGAAFVGAMALSARAAIQFEERMRNVSTISAAAEQDLQGVGNIARGIALELPQSANQMAEAFYDVASAGFAGRASMEVLGRASAGAASAGLTDAATSARALTAVLNAYGRSATDVSDVSDVLFQTVNLGVITFEELAQNVGDWIGTAAAAKVPVEDAAAALAAMTLSGVTAAESGTSLNRVLQTLLDPSDDLKDALHALGYESGASALKADGLRGVMVKIGQATAGDAEAMQKLFPEIRAMRGALALTAAGGANYTRTFEGIADSTNRAGSTQRALELQSKSLAYQMRLARNAVMDLAIGFGQSLAPVLRPIVSGLRAFVDGLRMIDGPARGFLVVGGSLVAIVAALGGGLLLLAPRLVALRTLLQTTAAAGTAMGTALRVSMLALGGLTALLGLVSVGLGIFAARKAQAADQARAFATAMEAENAGHKNALRIAARREAAEKGIIDLMRERGLVATQATDAILGDQKAVDQLARELQAQVPAFRGSGDAFMLLRDAINGSDDAARKLQITLDREGGWGKDEADILKLVRGLGGLSDAHSGAREEVEEHARQLREEERAAGRVVGPVDEATAALRAMETGAEGADGAVEKLTDSQKELQKALASFGTAASVYDDLMGEMEDRQREWAEKQADATASTEDSWKDFQKPVQVSLKDFTARLEQGNTEAQKWAEDLAKVSVKVGSDVAQELGRMGKEGGPLIKRFLEASQSDAERAAAAMRLSIQRNSDAAAVLLESTLGSIGATIAAKLAVGAEDVKRISANYAVELARGLNPILAAVGAPLIPGLGFDTREYTDYKRERGKAFAHGGIEDHRAQIAAGGPIRVWAEPETGGEAYIPLAPGKRDRSTSILADVARRFGYSLMAFAEGGLAKPPTPFPHGGMARSADRATVYAYEAAAKKAAEVEGGLIGDGQIGSGYQAILRYLAAVGVPHRATSTIRPGSITTSGRLSLHAIGKAVDLVGPNMMRIFQALLPMAGSLRELFFTPAGFSIKNGQRVPPIAAAGHYDHVHAATYDRGGYLPPGLSMAYNGTGRPEPVFPAAALERAMTRALAAAPARNVHVEAVVPATVSTPTQVGRAIARAVR